MQSTPDDKLAASVFAVGLSLGFLRREDIIRWADRRISQVDIPDTWLIDLSLARDRDWLEVTDDLRHLASDVDPVATCTAVYALLPDISGYTFDQAADFARRLYEITHHSLNGDWENELLPISDNLMENFELVRAKYVKTTEHEVIAAVQQFVAEHRSAEIVRMLDPVRWSVAQENAKIRDEGGTTMYVGLSSWIMQDGNYGDFKVGQEAEFALEFYAPKGLQSAQSGPRQAQHVGANSYHVRAQIAFIGPEVWVIDAGEFMAFKEMRPPVNAAVGAWVEGEVHVGIDPFFYSAYLHQIVGMPPLIYKWLVRAIQRDTTPLVEEKDGQGRSLFVRDQTRVSFVPTYKTDAWHDDDGNAEYVLECARLSGPKMPGRKS